MSAESKLAEIKDGFSLTSASNIPDRANNDINELYVLIKQAQKNVTVAARNGEEEQSNNFAEFDAKFKKLIDLESNLNEQKQAFDKLREHISQNKKVQDPVDLFNKLKNENTKRNTNTQDKYNKNRHYLNFRQSIWQINHPDEVMPGLSGNDDDEDIVVGATKISLKCPITTTWLENPVTSNLCNHTYSKAAIFGLLNRGGFISCPIPGCDKPVTRQSLADDPDMVDRVARARARETESQAQQFFDV